jgi:hypothetical protein
MNHLWKVFVPASPRKAAAVLIPLLTIFLTSCSSGVIAPGTAEPSQGEPVLAFDFESLAGSPPEGFKSVQLRDWAWSSDGRYFYASFDNGILRRIELGQRRVEAEVTSARSLSHIALSTDGHYLAGLQRAEFSFSPEGRFTLGDIPRQKFELRSESDLVLLDAQSLAEIARRPERGEQCALLYTLAFNRDGSSLWVGCYANDTGAPSEPVAVEQIGRGVIR